MCMYADAVSIVVSVVVSGWYSMRDCTKCVALSTSLPQTEHFRDLACVSSSCLIDWTRGTGTGRHKIATTYDIDAPSRWPPRDRVPRASCPRPARRSHSSPALFSRYNVLRYKSPCISHHLGTKPPPDDLSVCGRRAGIDISIGIGLRSCLVVYYRSTYSEGLLPDVPARTWHWRQLVRVRGQYKRVTADTYPYNTLTNAVSRVRCCNVLTV